jgi:hypothetical protein
LPFIDWAEYPYDEFHLSFNFESRIVSPTLQTCFIMQLLVHHRWTPPSCSSFDNLMAINRSIILEAYGELRPLIHLFIYVPLVHHVVHLHVTPHR